MCLFSRTDLERILRTLQELLSSQDMELKMVFLVLLYLLWLEVKKVCTIVVQSVGVSCWGWSRISRLVVIVGCLLSVGVLSDVCAASQGSARPGAPHLVFDGVRLYMPGEKEGICLDPSALARMKRFILWSLIQAPFGKFEGEKAPCCESFLYANRYSQHLLSYVRHLVGCMGNGVRETSMVTHINALTRWARAAETWYGTVMLPKELAAIVNFSKVLWERQKRHNIDFDTLPWPEDAEPTTTEGLAPAPKARRLRVAGEDHAETGLYFPFDCDGLREEELHADTPWWIRIMFMRVPEPVGVLGEIMWAPRLQELQHLGFSPDSPNYVDLEKKEIVLRSFKNSHRKPVRKIPLPDEWVARFRRMLADPQSFGTVPSNTSHQMHKWLRPVCIKAYGEERGSRIVINNRSIRVMAFSEIMHRIATRPVKPVDLVHLGDCLQMYHDHTFGTALRQYSKQLPSAGRTQVASMFMGMAQKTDGPIAAFAIHLAVNTESPESAGPASADPESASPSADVPPAPRKPPAPQQPLGELAPRALDLRGGAGSDDDDEPTEQEEAELAAELRSRDERGGYSDDDEDATSSPNLQCPESRLASPVPRRERSGPDSPWYDQSSPIEVPSSPEEAVANAATGTDAQPFVVKSPAPNVVDAWKTYFKGQGFSMIYERDPDGTLTSGRKRRANGKQSVCSSAMYYCCSAKCEGVKMTFDDEEDDYLCDKCGNEYMFENGEVVRRTVDI